MMNSKDYRKAVDCFEPDPFLRTRLAAAVEGARPARSHPARRVFAVALAAALALACTMAALAVSPELRASVVSLFQMDVVEQVPGIPEGSSEVKQVVIGEGVTAQYVRVEGFWCVGNGLLQDEKYHEGTGYRARYYDLIDGQLVEVGTDAREAAVQLTWNGVERSARFWWFVYNGTLYYNEDGRGEVWTDGESDLLLGIQTIGNRTDKLMLTAADIGARRDTWSWVYDLETGEVTDVLAGCGLEDIGPIRRLRMSEDLKHALAWVGYMEESTPYLVDLEAKTCTSLRDVFGMELREGQFPDENGEAVEIQFSGDDVLLIRFRDQFMETERLPHINGAWTYHIPSGMVTQTVSENEQPLVMAPLTLSLTENGEVTVVDLRTGNRTRLEGVTAFAERYQDYRCYPNLTNTKLLWADMDGDRVARMGIVDLEKGTFRAFDRDDQSGQEELKFEYMYWLYDDRVASVRELGWDPEMEAYPYQICVYDF